ncbi:MAG: L-threonylcarbamoyladenylate synthase [Candidatus Altiarchaeota archaeon]
MPETLLFKEELAERLVDRVVRILSDGGVILYPTDTVYGLGCDILSEGGVEKIFSLKCRDRGAPLSIAVSDLSMLRECALMDEDAEKKVKERMPGPYTFILKKRGCVPDFVTSGYDTVGIRIPDHAPLLELISKYGKPIITTSANRSGEPAPSDIGEVSREIKEGMDLILDGGRCREGKPSTIIDLSSGKDGLIKTRR